DPGGFEKEIHRSARTFELRAFTLRVAEEEGWTWRQENKQNHKKGTPYLTIEGLGKPRGNSLGVGVQPHPNHGHIASVCASRLAEGSTRESGFFRSKTGDKRNRTKEQKEKDDGQYGAEQRSSWKNSRVSGGEVLDGKNKPTARCSLLVKKSGPPISKGCMKSGRKQQPDTIEKNKVLWASGEHGKGTSNSTGIEVREDKEMLESTDGCKLGYGKTIGKDHRKGPESGKGLCPDTDAVNRRVWEWNERVWLSDQAKTNIRWLTENLERYNGRPAWRPSLVKSLFVDASTTGWCAKLEGQTAFGNWRGKFDYQEIAKLEARFLGLDIYRQLYSISNNEARRKTVVAKEAYRRLWQGRDISGDRDDFWTTLDRPNGIPYEHEITKIQQLPLLSRGGGDKFASLHEELQSKDNSSDPRMAISRVVAAASGIGLGGPASTGVKGREILGGAHLAVKELSQKAKVLAKEAVSPFYKAKAEKYWTLYEKFCERFELDVDNPRENGILAFIMWLDVIGLTSQILRVLQVVINNLRFEGKKNFRKLLGVAQVLKAIKKEVSKSKTPDWPRDPLPVAALRHYMDVPPSVASGSMHRRDVALVALGLRTMRRLGELGELTMKDDNDGILLLKQYLEIQPATSLEVPLFLSRQGKKVSVVAIGSVVKQFAEHAGLNSKFTAHSLKIGESTTAMMAGISLSQIRAIG
ncbi:21813_t:CDS:10, partial [Gigaspora margarita]